MNHILKTSSFMLLFACLSSCKINGTFKGLHSYYDVTRNDGVIAFMEDDSSYCESTYKASTVYVTNGNILRRCVAKTDKSLVYIWKPNCQGKYCYSLNLLQKYSTDKGIELFVVAEYYDTEKMNMPYKISKPLVGIDTEYYGTNLTSKYLSKFIADLIKGELAPSKQPHSFLFFERGEFISSHVDLEGLETAAGI